MRIWPAGRPCLYPLWRLFFTAKFRGQQKQHLADKGEELKLDADCIYALERWATLVISSGPPFLRMIPCSRQLKALWVAMWRYTPLRKPGRSLIFVGTQAVSWLEQEPGPLLHKYERYEFWL